MNVINIVKGFEEHQPINKGVNEEFSRSAFQIINDMRTNPK